jgi:mannose-6-phosphate isomerase-like protein (cupin superfamily)
LRNNYFRKVLVTEKNSQLVVMCLLPGEEIGMEIHKKYDQILVNVSGKGKCILNKKNMPFNQDDLVFVPKGTWHNFINTGKSKLKLFTIYSPSNHPPGTIHKTKEDAMNAEDDD